MQSMKEEYYHEFTVPATHKFLIAASLGTAIGLLSKCMLTTPKEPSPRIDPGSTQILYKSTEHYIALQLVTR